MAGNGGWAPFDFTGTAEVAVGSSGPGSILHTLVVNTPAAGTITISDTDGTNVAISWVVTVTTGEPFYLMYDSIAAYGWRIAASVAMDITVNYS